MNHDATIALLLPTRGRPQSAIEALQSIAATAARPELLRVVVGIDDDDAESLEAVRGFSAPYTMTVDVKSEALGFNHRVHLMLPATEGCAIVGFFADDVRMATSRWDDRVREAASIMPGGYGVMYFKDPLHKMFPAYPIVTAAMIHELGFFFEPFTPYWFSDAWLHEIAQMIGCLLPVDAALENPHGKGLTHHMREWQFWADWFNATRPQRVMTARRLIPKMYPHLPHLRITLLNDIPSRVQFLQLLRASHKRNPRFLKSMESSSMESGPPPARYLEAKRVAIEYLRKMRADLGIQVEDQFSTPPSP